MTIILNYCGHFKMGFLQLEDKRFNIEIDFEYEKLLELKEQLDEVIKLIQEEQEQLIAERMMENEVRDVR